MTSPLWTKHGFWVWKLFRCGHREIRWREGRWEIRFEMLYDYTDWQWLCYAFDDSLSSELEAKELALGTMP